MRTSRVDAGAEARASGVTRTIILPLAAFGLVAGGLFAVNMAISGDWNYQGGGDRRSYYFEFPFQNDVPVHDLGVSKSRENAYPVARRNRNIAT
jgi:hypothetical protein